MVLKKSARRFVILAAIVAMLGIYLPLIRAHAAESWVSVGSPYSDDDQKGQSLAISPSGTPYVGYTRNISQDEDFVIEYNGSSWVDLGGGPLMSYDSGSPSLVISASGTPYVMYGVDDTGDSRYEKGLVEKFNSGSGQWVAVGSPLATGDHTFADDVRVQMLLSFDPSGNLYAAYNDWTNSDAVTVKKFNTASSSWVSVGQPISVGDVTDNVGLSFAINASGTPYVAYSDANNNEALDVQEYNGSAWVPVGSSVASSSATYGSLAISASGTPYVAYDNGGASGGNEGQDLVEEYNGSAWVQLGSLITTVGGVGPNSDLSLAISPSGVPYLAYGDGSNTYALTVDQYNSGTGQWSIVGNTISPLNVEYPSLAINSSSVPYVAYSDGTPEYCQGVGSGCWETRVFSYVPIINVASTTGGGAISADTNGTDGSGVYTGLSGPVLTESTPGNMSTGTIILDSSFGFSFNPMSTVTATVTTVGSCSSGGDQPLLLGSGSGSSTEIATTTQARITINIFKKSAGESGCASNVTFTGVAVRPNTSSLSSGSVVMDASSSAVLPGITPGSTDLGDLNEIPGAPAQLNFLSEPQDSEENVSIEPFSVEVEDAYGNVVTDDNSAQITMGIKSGSGAPGAVLSGTLTQTVSSGTASFDDLSINATGTGYQFTATSNPMLTATDSSPFNILPVGFNAFTLLGQNDSNGDPIWSASDPNNGSSSVNAQGFEGDVYTALDTTYHRLFVADNQNNRVLIFQLDDQNNITTTTASAVLGQTDLVSNAATSTQNGFDGPSGLSYDPASGRLFVLDAGNNRVMVFNVIPPVTNGENAEAVIGQDDYTSNGYGTSQNQLTTSEGIGFCHGYCPAVGATSSIMYDGASNRLFVADIFNNRVLVFDASTSTLAATSTGENAEDVIGQMDFDSNDSATTQNGLNTPDGLAYDSTNDRLFVADNQNNRVLVFDASTSTLAATSTGENAEDVLGQTDFMSGDPATSQNGLSGPSGLAYDSTNDRLFVADNQNNRVLVFDASTSTLAATSTGENAEDVIGQMDFVSGGAVAMQDGMNAPNGLTFDPTTGHFFVADTQNNRVMVFSLVHIITSSLPSGVSGSSYSETISATSTQGTVSFSLSAGSLPPGLTLSSSTGVISGTPTSAGEYSFTVQASDDVPPVPFVDTATYDVTITNPIITNGGGSGGGGGGGGGAYYTPTFTSAATSTSVSSAQSLLQSLIGELGSLVSRLNSQLVATFTRNLTIGSRGNDVKNLQIFLNDNGYVVSQAGIGSPGNEGTYFGVKTQSALAKWQKAHDLPATGYFGPLTRHYLLTHF